MLINMFNVNQYLRDKHLGDNLVTFQMCSCAPLELIIKQLIGWSEK